MHYLDRPVDVLFDAFQKRLRSQELGAPELNDLNRRRFGLSHQHVVRESVPADRCLGVDQEAWERLRINRRLER